ncbi:alcohol dehydrogenase catalytic domain-containing protein [Kineosporia babensis]|uniref:Alcohol dehydrogenase n=1 Tax=Kineosporia babensis TaxID=499548 RepID=A0A9X1SWI7_9ACTN|nr:alcohol dehydrogenase catalytic domain-containing protein [Kineosporia babensis]MCD5314784.1 alcohol dehydrogenase catalytic domain-containing protein [Kineosporia babensis]
MSVLRAVEIGEPAGAFRIVEHELPEPAPGHARIAVRAAGICHTDVHFVNHALPGLVAPVVPGHEVAGMVDAVGEGVDQLRWPVGKRVSVGWFGGSCGHCAQCRAGDFISCPALKVPGLSYRGGWASHLVVPVDALAAVPEGLSDVDAAPLGCAGVTTFQALRRSSARAGDLVAVIGVGGLGHLAVQYAVACGFETVAIARGQDKGFLSRDLGAHHYVDSSVVDPAKALQELGGAQVVVGTAHSSQAMAAGLEGLAMGGELLLVGFTPEPMNIPPTSMVPQSRRITGHPSGTAWDIEQTLRFSALSGVRPMTQVMPLDQVDEAWRTMISGAARFRMVLQP